MSAYMNEWVHNACLHCPRSMSGHCLYNVFCFYFNFNHCIASCTVLLNQIIFRILHSDCFCLLKGDMLSEVIDIHHCFQSSNIPKTDGGQIVPHPDNSPMTVSTTFDRHKNRPCWSKSILHGACQYLLPTTFQGP